MTRPIRTVDQSPNATLSPPAPQMVTPAILTARLEETRSLVTLAAQWIAEVDDPAAVNALNALSNALLQLARVVGNDPLNGGEEGDA